VWRVPWKLEPEKTARLAPQLGLAVGPSDPFARGADWPYDLGVGYCSTTGHAPVWVAAVAVGGMTEQFLGSDEATWLALPRGSSAVMGLVFGARALETSTALHRTSVCEGWRRIVALEDERGALGVATRLASLLGTARAILAAHTDAWQGAELAAANLRLDVATKLERAAPDQPLVRPAAFTIGDVPIDGKRVAAIQIALELDAPAAAETIALAQRHARSPRHTGVPPLRTLFAAADPCQLRTHGSTVELAWCLRERHLTRPVLLGKIAAALAWNNQREAGAIYR
jgi:hypothetical protein